MIENLSIYRTSADALGLFDTFLGGFFFIKGLPLLFQLFVIIFFTGAAAFAFLTSVKKNPVFEKVSIACSLVLFLLIVSLLWQPWDELFVNLSHSLHFAKDGHYSFFKNRAVEGTVDFLPYFTIGILGKLGLPLLELAFLMSLLGGFFCLGITSRLMDASGIPNGKVWGFLAASIFAPLCFNSASGFSGALFSAVILSSFYFLLVKKQSNLSLLLLALIPLIRTEGVWFVFLFICFFRQEFPKKSWVALAFLPFVLLTAFRLSYFGHAIPAPIRFKSALGNVFFSLIGLRNLAADLTASYTILFLAIYLIDYKTQESPNSKQDRDFLRFLLILILYVLPYYSSGGDWFPASWGRYFLPLSLYSFILGISSLVSLFSRWEERRLFALSGFVILILVASSSGGFGSYPQLLEQIFSLKKVLANTTFKRNLHTNFRIHYLSQVGTHLGSVSEPDDKIGSSELSTIMYFAKREPVDFLGLTNEDIISQPLRTPELFRRFPSENELPYLIFKRLNPDLLKNNHPSFLYAFDFISKDLNENIEPQELTNEEIIRMVKRWEIRFHGLITPLYGGIENILHSGYHPIVVVYGNKFSTLYFVSNEVFSRHRARLQALGFTSSQIEK